MSFFWHNRPTRVTTGPLPKRETESAESPTALLLSKIDPVCTERVIPARWPSQLVQIESILR